MYATSMCMNVFSLVFLSYTVYRQYSWVCTSGVIDIQYASILIGFDIFSPIIGGSLSKPAERFPHLFGGSNFLKKYPYILPCSVPATYTLVAWLVTFFFLKEVNHRILHYV